MHVHEHLESNILTGTRCRSSPIHTCVWERSGGEIRNSVPSVVASRNLEACPRPTSARLYPSPTSTEALTTEGVSWRALPQK